MWPLLPTHDLWWWSWRCVREWQAVTLPGWTSPDAQGQGAAARGKCDHEWFLSSKWAQVQAFRSSTADDGRALAACAAAAGGGQLPWAWRRRSSHLWFWKVKRAVVIWKGKALLLNRRGAAAGMGRSNTSKGISPARCRGSRRAPRQRGPDNVQFCTQYCTILYNSVQYVQNSNP